MLSSNYGPKLKGRAAVYGRASTDNQDTGLSTATQAEHGRRLGELLGFIVEDDDIYLDEGISGMTDDRSACRQVMLKVFSPERPYEAVIVTDLSRLTRSSRGYINYEEIFAEEGIQLISHMDPPSNGQAKIDTNRRMTAVMNERQVVVTAEKTRNSQMLVVEMGFYIGWVAPFGYRKKKVMWRGAEHTVLEPDPETWPHLIHVKEMAKDNYTLSQIRQYLDSTGLRHPAEKIPNKKRGGKRGTGRWTNSNVSYLLKNRVLLGWTLRGGAGSGSKLLHKSEQVICRNAHEAAMTEEERELILRNLARRTREVKSPRSNRSPNPMAGLVVCGLCGATMRMHTEDGKQRLICANKRDHRKGEPLWCPNQMAGLDILVERTTEAILGHILTPKVMRQQVELVAEENRKLAAHERSRKEPIEKRIKQLDKEIANFMAAIAEYGPTNPAFGREIDRRQEEKELLERQRKQIDSELEEKLVFINDQERIVENALSLRTYLESEDPHDLTEMLNSLIRKVSIVNKVATLHYSVPLPRNQTADPILMERLNLDKKTCPSVPLTGARLPDRRPVCAHRAGTHSRQARCATCAYQKTPVRATGSNGLNTHHPPAGGGRVVNQGKGLRVGAVRRPAAGRTRGRGKEYRKCRTVTIERFPWRSTSAASYPARCPTGSPRASIRRSSRWRGSRTFPPGGGRSSTCAGRWISWRRRWNPSVARRTPARLTRGTAPLPVPAATPGRASPAAGTRLSTAGLRWATARPPSTCPVSGPATDGRRQPAPGSVRCALLGLSVRNLAFDAFRVR